ncbi:hypothetical protein [Photobacterium damselae]|uniref:hypothetical protein n=1 Tax=Photobacterium damselae TaxID=38293 RepID=UPI0012463EB2|nr:hypothetical protein [Photobacterium damselae]KAB1183757.1 hypothetical protein F6477_00685 [Photobacterium damselae subsp. damselae]MBF7101442.1 hypothetical protein [Photobacterium damselae]
MSECVDLDTPVILDKPNVYFSDFFEVSRETIDEYGAFDISLINDIPLFIDPFLVYKNEKYRHLHDEIVKYLIFLQDNANNNIDDKNLNEWFMFHEVKENWFGFSVDSNKGSGLAKDFANKLNLSINNIFKQFGSNENSNTVHIEKFCLCQDKIGKDKISDFTTNIIKDYLLSYTENFATNFINSKLCKNISVKRAYFDYDNKIWVDKDYYLPIYNGEHVILSPIDLLTKDNTWICKNDVIKSHYQFKKVLNHISDSNFAKEVFDFYDRSMLLATGNRTKYHKMVMNDLIKKYPSYLDYYIKYKTESDGEKEASKLTDERIFKAKSLFLNNGNELISYLKDTPFFNKEVKNSSDLREKLIILKNILNKSANPLFIRNKKVTNAKEIKILFSILLKANNCLKDNFKLSNSFETKMATNPYLDNFLLERSRSDTNRQVVVIICYSLKKANEIRSSIGKFNLSDDDNIIIIEAVHD